MARKTKYDRRVALPTVLLIGFIALIAYFLNEHWDIYPALHSAGKFALAIIAIIIAFIIFDVVVGSFAWIMNSFGELLKGAFGGKKKK